MNMRESCRNIYLLLLLAVVLNACASRPPPIPQKRTAANSSSLPVEIQPSPAELLIRRIQQNKEDIRKYFIIDEDKNIIVKADLQDPAGEFEVIYHLDKAAPVTDSGYEILFSARNKETGILLEDAFIWTPRAGNAGLLLSFDDDYIESWERSLDLFDTYGAKVTFFIKGKFDPFCIKALGRGHDIGYHSLNHLDLRKISAAEFAKETIEPAEAFRKTGVPLASFAYPYGFFEPWMHEILLRSFSVLRGYGVTFCLYYKNEITSACIASRAIDNTVIPGEENFDLIIRSMLMTVKFLDDDRILPLTSHRISEAAWAISPRRLEFLLKTAADLGLQFYLYRDFADL